MNGVPTLTQYAERAHEQMNPDDLFELVRMFTLLPQFAAMAGADAGPERAPIAIDSNEEMWQQYYSRQLPDTSRIQLNQFHLFDWFPLSPGRFHTEDGAHFRIEAREALQVEADGVYYNPYGKVNMIKGGVGAVKLSARLLTNEHGRQEPYYLMTASSNGVCHEGIPILIPRSRYAGLIDRLRDEGAVPVRLEGEMKPLPPEARSFFDSYHLANIPSLVIHADRVEVLPRPRPEVTRYAVSIAVSFYGVFQGQKRVYMTYCTFDPASQASRKEKVDWLRQYVANYQGRTITDFDEEFPEFREAPFALRRVMKGELDPLVIEEMMDELGYYYLGNSGDAVRNAIIQHNSYTWNYVGSRGVQVMGDVGGHIVTGDDTALI
jgi:hypothetical protein